MQILIRSRLRRRLLAYGWEEGGRRRDTTARSRTDAIAKAGELVERLGRGTATDLARASGAELVAHYLDPGRRPPRVKTWSERHRDEQVRYCQRYVLPTLAGVPCRRMTRLDFQAVLLRGVRWRPAEGGEVPEPPGLAVIEVEIPTTTAVHALARATVEHTECGGESWRSSSWPPRASAGENTSP